MKREETPDMSPEAIDQRMRDLSEIYSLGMSLLSAKRIGPVLSRPEDGDDTLHESFHESLPPETPMPPADFIIAIDDFIAVLEAASPHTRRAYRRDLEHFTGWLGTGTTAVARAPFAPATITAYRLHMRNRQLRPATIHRRLMAIRSYLTWASPEILDDAAGTALRSEVAPRRPEWLHPDDDKALVAAALRAMASANGNERALRQARRTAAMLLLMLRIGLRVSEVRDLKRQHLDLIGSRIVLDDRTVPLDAETATVLEAWLPLCAEAEAVFPGSGAEQLALRTVQTSIEAVARSAAIGRRVSPRLLRHTAAVRWAEAGVPVSRIARRLGVKPASIQKRLPTHRSAGAALEAPLSLRSTNPLMRQARAAFDRFVGNRDTIELLVPELAEALGHSPPVMSANIMFTGVASTGKTTLARMIAAALGTPFIEVTGGGLSGIEVLLALIGERLEIDLSPPDPGRGASRESNGGDDEDDAQGAAVQRVTLPPLVVFIDEAHDLSLKAQSSMLTLFEPTDRKYEHGSVTVNARQVTFCFATTDFGRLAGPLRTRVDEYHLVPYTLDEIVEILHVHPEVPRFEDRRLRERLAIAGQLVPRQAIRCAQKLGIFARQHPERNLYDLLDYLYRRWKLDADGLGDKHRRYLAELAKATEPVGLGRLSDVLGMGTEEITRVVEPLLIHHGRIQITGRGRVLVESG